MPTERSAEAQSTEEGGNSSKGKGRFPQFAKLRNKSKDNDGERKVIERLTNCNMKPVYLLVHV